MKQRDTELILRVARLYYEKNQSQDQVAQFLGTSRSNISRMLSDAKRLGYVQIKIVAPVTRHDTLSGQLHKVLSIRDVQVVGSDRSETTMTSVGRAAAVALTRALKTNCTIAISWGRGVEAAVVEVQSESLTGLKVTQLMGGLSSIATSISGEELGRKLAQNLHAQFLPLLAPAVVSNLRSRNTLLSEDSISHVLEISRRADIALVGIGSRGSPSSEGVLKHFRLTKLEHERVSKVYAGDVSARFYDHNGRSVSSELDNRVVGLTLDEIANISHVIGIAAGSEKALGVLGASRAGLIDTLVIDVACATEVLKFVTAERVVRSA
jgi:DNA-binding transcriptional regulator LsrR (DeoR family)